MKNAFEIIQPTFERTKELLWPINIRLWAKLAFIALLAGFGSGGFSGNWGQRQDMSPSEFETFRVWISDFLEKWWKVILLVVLLLFALWLIMTFLSSVFKFIFYDGITKKETGIRASFRRNLGQGTSLFVFMLLFGIIVLAFVVLLIYFMVYPLIASNFAGDFPNYLGTFFISLCLLCCVFLPLLLLALLIIEDFTIPIMYAGRKGFLPSTGRALSLISGNFVQFIIYILARIILGIILAIIGIFLLLPLIIPVLAIAFLLILPRFYGFDFMSVTIQEIVFWIVAFIPISILLGYAASFLLLPVTVFSRFFPLMFLRELDPELNFEA